MEDIDTIEADLATNHIASVFSPSRNDALDFLQGADL